MTRASALDLWPIPFDPECELDWSDPAVSRRLLREHLDPRHDSASRRPARVARHIARLRRLLPGVPARILDAACGPGLYAVPLAAAGYDVTGFDVGPAVITHARAMAREHGVAAACTFRRASLLDIELPSEFEAALLIYHVLEAFPRSEQPRVLRRLGNALTRHGRLIVEMRTRADHAEGRVTSWDVADWSLLADRRHLLLTDSTYDGLTGTHVLRETAVFDDGSTARQQTTAQLTPLHRIAGLFRRGGLEVVAVYDGWSPRHADETAGEVLVVARRA